MSRAQKVIYVNYETFEELDDLKRTTGLSFDKLISYALYESEELILSRFSELPVTSEHEIDEEEMDKVHKAGLEILGNILQGASDIGDLFRRQDDEPSNDSTD